MINSSNTVIKIFFLSLLSASDVKLAYLIATLHDVTASVTSRTGTRTAAFTAINTAGTPSSNDRQKRQKRLLRQQQQKAFVNLIEMNMMTAPTSTKIMAAVKAEEEKCVNEDGIRPCFYKPKNQQEWRERILINDLTVGKPLVGYVVQDLLDGVTGPKVFLECGVGRVDKKNNWNIVNGMLRLPVGKKRKTKESVNKKRAERLRKKDEITCYVSRVQVECGRFEVVLKKEDIPTSQNKFKSISSIVPREQEGEEELVGTVKEVRPYGVLVDVGANRPGLLHIKKVAELYGRYINKEKGLEGAGLRCGDQIRVVAVSNEKRRLSLDFPTKIKATAERELSGTIREIRPYGLLVDVGAKSLGLLHIKKVSELYGRFIRKKKGLEDAGLRPGDQLRVVAAFDELGRISLDFPTEMKTEAEQERLKEQEQNQDSSEQKQQQQQQQQQNRLQTTTATATSTSATTATTTSGTNIAEDEAAAWAAYCNKEDDDKEEEEDTSTTTVTTTTVATTSGTNIAEDEAAAWAAYYNNEDSDEEDDDTSTTTATTTYGTNTSEEEAAAWAAYYNNEDDDEEDDDSYDDYDEDRDIEDQLGLGSW